MRSHSRTHPLSLTPLPSYLPWTILVIVGLTVAASTAGRISVNASLLVLSGTGLLLAILYWRKHRELVGDRAFRRRLVEDQTEFVVQWRPDGESCFFNETYERFLAGTEELPEYWSFLDCISNQDLEAISQKVGELTPDSPCLVAEHRVVRANGETIWTGWSHRGIFNKRGKLTEIQSVGRDIGERKRAEEKLRQSEERYRNLYQEVSRLKDELERERDCLREEVNVAGSFGEIVGQSPALKRVLARIEAVAATDTSVLIQGESGVGKELVARAIYRRSQRAAGPLVKVNCASVPRELFESEFFGHVRGSFTGAHRDRIGRFQLAHGGTLFLDEVAEIPYELQGKLLRVLQEGEFERVGEEATRKVDVRIIAATNRDLEAEVEAGRYRQDLFYRLSVFPMEVPPLRLRRSDIVPLAAHFLELACRELGRSSLSLTRSQASALEAYDWPGNVRELRNVIERAVIFSNGDRLRLDLAIPHSGRTTSQEPVALHDLDESNSFITHAEFKRLQRRNITAALEHADWRVAGKGGAAELLELKPSTLTYQMKALGVVRPQRRASA